MSMPCPLYNHSSGSGAQSGLQKPSIRLRILLALLQALARRPLPMTLRNPSVPGCAGQDCRGADRLTTQWIVAALHLPIRPQLRSRWCPLFPRVHVRPDFRTSASWKNAAEMRKAFSLVSQAPMPHRRHTSPCSTVVAEPGSLEVVQDQDQRFGIKTPAEDSRIGKRSLAMMATMAASSRGEETARKNPTPDGGPGARAVQSKR